MPPPAAAFETFSVTTRQERIALLEKIIDAYKARSKDIAAAISDEMGAPLTDGPACAGRRRPRSPDVDLAGAEGLFTSRRRSARPTVVREPDPARVGHDHPMELAAQPDRLQGRAGDRGGCAVDPEAVARSTPTSTRHLRRGLHEAGVPKGVFNLVNGEGPVVGVASTPPRRIDLISFTGSTRAGVESRTRGHTIKRVSARARRQVAERHPAETPTSPRRSPVASRTMMQQLGPVLGRADTDDRAAERNTRRRRSRRRSPTDEGQATRRPKALLLVPWSIARSRSRSRRLIGDGRRRGRDRRRRRSGPARRRHRGLLREARPCSPTDQRDDRRARGDLRSGDDDHSAPGRGRSDRDGERHALRPRPATCCRVGRERASASAVQSAPAT